MADENKGEFLQVEDMTINVKDLRIPWGFTHFALNHKESPGVIGKVFLRMLGMEDVKIDKKYESDCRLFRLEFVNLMRDCLDYQETRKGGKKKKKEQAQPPVAEEVQSPVNYPQNQMRPSESYSQDPDGNDLPF